jgi:DNA-binding transcriptional MerR regulator
MKLFYSSDEAAEHLGVPFSRLDFYVREFKLPIKKVKRVRKYSHDDLEKLERIIKLIDVEGYTIEGAKEKIRFRESSKSHNQMLINRLQEIKKTLIFLKNSIE